MCDLTTRGIAACLQRLAQREGVVQVGGYSWIVLFHIEIGPPSATIFVMIKVTGSAPTQHSCHHTQSSG
jgi:hypothetical protein